MEKLGAYRVDEAGEEYPADWQFGGSGLRWWPTAPCGDFLEERYEMFHKAS